MSENLLPQLNAQSNYGESLDVAKQNFADGLYANGQSALQETKLVSKESMAHRAGFALGKLMLKGSVLINSIKPKSSEPSKLTNDDLASDMSQLRSELVLAGSQENNTKAPKNQDTEKYQEYAEFDRLNPRPMPKIVDIDTSDRNLSVKTQSGEVVTEAEYIERFMLDLADNPDFQNKMQWLGEKELIHSMAEQAKWLVGRMLDGQNILVVSESWHRKVGKSGEYISNLIVNAAKLTIESEGLNTVGKIITDEELRQGDKNSIDRAVIFEDWIGSGSDMDQRARWTTNLLDEFGIAQDKLSINLLAAQTKYLNNGFEVKHLGPDARPNLRVMSPFEIEQNNGDYHAPFSGIHSDMDYAFTMLQEVHDAVEARRGEVNGFPTASSYEISSIDTLGDPDFHALLEGKLQSKLVEHKS